ncbi:MAG TPA: hypothetical protein VKB86_11490 [Pyrinomonadaceae bacterium]|nr:hypothetical protein [Pyrinomonadaceae bacterium]
MTRRLLLVILCSVLLLLSIIRGRSYEASTKFRIGANELSFADENKAALALPKQKSSWLVEISRSGGMRPVKQTVQLNSTKEIMVTSEALRNGQNTITCSRKEKLSERDFLKIKAAVTSAKPSAWETDYFDPKHPICCDQPSTHIKLSLRDDKGKEQDYSTSWYPGSYSLVPTDLKALETFIQPLWSAVEDRCNK